MNRRDFIGRGGEGDGGGRAGSRGGAEAGMQEGPGREEAADVEPHV